MSDNGYYRERVKRAVSPESALSKLMVLCSRSEKCSGDAYKLLKRWEISESDAAAIIAQLVESRYVDDERYARAYVRDKARYSGWGAYKIRMSLKAKGLLETIIENALLELDEYEVLDKLVVTLQKKRNSIKGDISNYELKGKLFRFAVQRGYSFDQINSALAKVVL